MYKFGGEKHRKTKEFGFQIILVRNSHVSTCLKKIKVLCRRTPQYPKSEGSRKTCRASYSGSMKALICSKGMSLAGRLQATGLIFSTAIKTIHVTYPVLFIDWNYLRSIWVKLKTLLWLNPDRNQWYFPGQGVGSVSPCAFWPKPRTNLRTGHPGTSDSRSPANFLRKAILKSSPNLHVLGYLFGRLYHACSSIDVWKEVKQLFSGNAHWSFLLWVDHHLPLVTSNLHECEGCTMYDLPKYSTTDADQWLLGDSGGQLPGWSKTMPINQ